MACAAAFPGARDSTRDAGNSVLHVSNRGSTSQVWYNSWGVVGAMIIMIMAMMMMRLWLRKKAFNSLFHSKKVAVGMKLESGQEYQVEWCSKCDGIYVLGDDHMPWSCWNVVVCQNGSKY